jgi:hypothetical protein
MQGVRDHAIESPDYGVKPIDTFEHETAAIVPHLRIILNRFPLEFERMSIPYIVADIFFVDKDLMDCSTSPGTAEIC